MPPNNSRTADQKSEKSYGRPAKYFVGESVASVLLVEENTILRQALGIALNGVSDVRVVGQCSTLCAGEKLIENLRPRVVLVGLTVDEMGILLNLRRWRRMYLETRIVLLLPQHMAEVIDIAKNYGAVGHASHDDSLTSLHNTVLNAAREPRHTSSREQHGLAQKKPLPIALSARETQVLRLIAAGCGRTEIAQRLGISVKTIERHRENLKLKLHSSSSVELLREAWVRFGNKALLPAL